MSATRNIQFKLNGRQVSAEVRADHTLVEILSDQFNLCGARESCGQGVCGCCTIHVNGDAVSGCLLLASLVDGAEVRTVEGLGEGADLHPVQQAFLEAGAFQCGFCTPGFIMMIVKLLEENPAPTEHEIKHYLAGNLCRCSAYPEILAAVHLAAERMASARA